MCLKNTQVRGALIWHLSLYMQNLCLGLLAYCLHVVKSQWNHHSEWVSNREFQPHDREGFLLLPQEGDRQKFVSISDRNEGTNYN